MFPIEVPRIWRRRFTGATAVYLLNRYTVLFERIISIVEALSWHISDQRWVHFVGFEIPPCRLN